MASIRISSPPAPSVFAQGAQIGLTLISVPQAASQTFTVLETAPGQGTLSAGTFSSGALANSPFLFDAVAAFQPAANPATQSSKIVLTVTRKTTAQLGFDPAEAAALNAILAALPNSPNIEQVVLAQTTEAGLKGAFDQLLPDQGQGLFEALDAAAEAISDLTSTSTTSDAPPGQSLWLQEVNERVNRTGVQTLGSNTKLLGLIGGYEVPAAGGAIGVDLAYFNAQEQDTTAAIGEHTVASMVEVGAYARRSFGPLTVAANGGVGYSWFTADRVFAAPGVFETASSGWHGLFADAHAEVSYVPHFGRFYVGPELSMDYLVLREGAHSEGDSGTRVRPSMSPAATAHSSAAGRWSCWGRNSAAMRGCAPRFAAAIATSSPAASATPSPASPADRPSVLLPIPRPAAGPPSACRSSRVRPTPTSLSRVTPISATASRGMTFSSPAAPSSSVAAGPALLTRPPLVRHLAAIAGAP